MEGGEQQGSIRILEIDVTKANNDYVRWNQLKDHGLVPDNEENQKIFSLR